MGSLGVFSESAEQFETVQKKNNSRVHNWLWLAMARHKAGQIDQAFQLLDKAVEWINHNPKAYWVTKLELSLLRQEAESLMETTAKDTASSENPATNKKTVPALPND